ncbi:hypothetical protein JOD57_004294 [Geodermatophilus bullaregiensis]|uniref:hypothetical protein n=1 Tax=Geodermatophilus bullaregiensis TaxID=1564160 RepID=UPI00195A435E|nr:hypothetical protein [Geodermatophilus bullaregiensis]MBM7808457.1 hypothetical protein [Geodermatophilus bullaregiensis]
MAGPDSCPVCGEMTPRRDSGAADERHDETTDPLVFVDHLWAPPLWGQGQRAEPAPCPGSGQNRAGHRRP